MTNISKQQDGFYRINQVLDIIPIGRSTLWKRVKDGEFPKPFKLSERTTVWRKQDVHDYVDSIGG